MMVERAGWSDRRRTGWNEREAAYGSVSRNAGEAYASRDDGTPRFVVHLLVTRWDLAGALNLVGALARSLAFMPEVDIGETTVSEEDAQHVHHRVFCDRRLPDRTRCVQRADHPDPCASYQIDGG